MENAGERHPWSLVRSDGDFCVDSGRDGVAARWVEVDFADDDLHNDRFTDRNTRPRQRTRTLRGSRGPRTERRRSGTYRIARAHPGCPTSAEADAEPCLRLARRLPWVAVTYGALTFVEIVVRGDHPASPSVIAPAATALSVSLVALMARHAMLGVGPLVGLASLASATHAWAFACLAADHDGARAFALTVVGGALVVARSRDLGVLLGAVGLSFLSALGTCAVAHPLNAALELAATSSVAFAFVAALEARARSAVQRTSAP